LGDNGTSAAARGDVEGGGGGSRTRSEIEGRREKERREREEEERLTWIKMYTSYANWTDVTGGHVVKDGWAASHTTVCGVTQLC
jgi:hypothetical protein